MSEKEDNDNLHVIAAFIGARLNYVLPPCNSGVRGGKLVSTIRVDQHKEKFWYIRIYCALADDSLVRDKWFRDNNDGPPDDEPTPEFKAKCLKNDASHYRNVYREMVRLQPHLESKICSHADYHELLFPSMVECEQLIDSTCGPTLQHLFKSYGVQDITGLKDYLRTIYDPGWKYRNADA